MLARHADLVGAEPGRRDPAGRSSRAPQPGGLRIAFLTYRGNPRCGGQGVYTRHISRELTALGHSVEVFSGAPWPELDEGVGFTPVPSLDLYREPDPFHVPHPREIRDRIDALEFGVMCVAGFPEPLTYSLRARQLLNARRADFDLIHDNQCLGTGITQLLRDGWPVIETLHHPITVDRKLALSHSTNPWQWFTIQRWFGFLRMQTRVARQLPAIVTVSQSSRTDIAAHMAVDADRMTVVPVGVDHTVFRPGSGAGPVPGRLMVTSSSDVPLKGLVPLLEAVAILRARRSVELVVIGRPRAKGRVDRAMERLGLRDCVTCVSGVSDAELARLYGEAEVAVVPSLYEGFSLPAVEAMACGVPVVATTGGALPEVVGPDGETAVLVEPNSPQALAEGIERLLDDEALRRRLGRAGRQRVLNRFTWQVTASGTSASYHALLEGRALPSRPADDGPPVPSAEGLPDLSAVDPAVDSAVDPSGEAIASRVPAEDDVRTLIVEPATAQVVVPADLAVTEAGVG